MPKDMTMKIVALKKSDIIDIIAPSSRGSLDELKDLHDILSSWGLKPRYPSDIFGHDLLCANSDHKRLEHLKNALLAADSKATICVRGGYGVTRLMPEIMTLKYCPQKLFIGMSDVTALHIFLQQQLDIPSLHAAINRQRFSEASLKAVKHSLFHPNEFTIDGTLLNGTSQKKETLKGKIIGGNLSILQTSIGTPWQVNPANKFLFLEEVNERGYRIDRILTHLQQAKVFDKAKAIVLGDFIRGEEKNGSSLVWPVLKRFANQLDIPVVQLKNIGHDFENLPMPLGIELTLTLGEKVRLENTPH